MNNPSGGYRVIGVNMKHRLPSRLTTPCPVILDYKPGGAQN